MTKNVVENTNYEKKESSTTKLSIKQQLTKLFLTSDIKNKKLWKPLRTSKTELIKNFHDGWFDVSYVNTLFRVYFHDHKDIYMPRYLKWLIHKQWVFIDRLDDPVPLDMYFYVLKKIRVELEPFTKSIQKLLAVSKVYDISDTDKQESDETILSDQENTIEQHHMFDKQQLSNVLTSEVSADDVCSPEWFSSLCTSIGTSRQENSYKDLIVFAVLGMHYFDKKHLVYSAFTPEQLAIPLFLSWWSKKNPVEIVFTLEEFLAIIDQLNFKKHFFDLQK